MWAAVKKCVWSCGSRKDVFVWEPLCSWLSAIETPLYLHVLPQPPSFQASLPPAQPSTPLLEHIPSIWNSLLPIRGCFPSSHLPWCTLQMHQPGVSGCFLFHVRAIPTGPQPNESFPPRYGEKITFRVSGGQSIQHGVQLPSPPCGGAVHSLYRAHMHGNQQKEGWSCVPLVFFILQAAT